MHSTRWMLIFLHILFFWPVFSTLFFTLSSALYLSASYTFVFLSFASRLAVPCCRGWKYKSPGQALPIPRGAVIVSKRTRTRREFLNDLSLKKENLTRPKLSVPMGSRLQFFESTDNWSNIGSPPLLKIIAMQDRMEVNRVHFPFYVFSALNLSTGHSERDNVGKN